MPFPDNSFECAVTGFAMRNVADIESSFLELRRVLKPGGRVVCLELTRPPSRLLATLYRPYLHYMVPLLGRVISGNGDAYAWLPLSLSSFPNAEG